MANRVRHDATMIVVMFAFLFYLLAAELTL